MEPVSHPLGSLGPAPGEGSPMFSTFEEMAEAALGYPPYPYQRRIADHGLPEVLAVETGAGKTAAIVLSWLWRRRLHPDPAVKAMTPHWLVMCEPMRALTEQTERVVREWLRKLSLTDEVLIHVAMGGRLGGEQRWRMNPERDAVVIGTIDVLLSRALNRGYGTGRFAWPIDFGLLNSGTHWVFDETQLLGPALATGRQLQAMRARFGTVGPTGSTWMSATVDRRSLSTVDNPYRLDGDHEVSLDDDDRTDAQLGRRLRGTRRVRRVTVAKSGRERSLADAALELHRPGTLTLVVVNRVRTAQAVYRALVESGSPVPSYLVHGRFRPVERESLMAELLAPSTSGASSSGRIVVATQVVEAGLDISAATLLTEAAPWPSIVQRAGRCNRDGSTADAVLAWTPVGGASAAPYLSQDVTAAELALDQLEGAELTAEELASVDVDVSEPNQPVLRRSDLLGLFDTAPDISGNDVDIGPFIRDGDERDLYVGWLELRPDESPSATPPPPGLCRVPMTKDHVAFLNQQGWRIDYQSKTSKAGAWKRVSATAPLRPGEIVVLPCTAGGYDPVIGWTPSVRTPVTALALPEDGIPELDNSEEEYGADTRSRAGRWVPLKEHLEDVERAVRYLTSELKDVSGLDDSFIEAAAVAGRLHDIGKAHPVFQRSLMGCAEEDDREQRELGIPWAKSGSSKRLIHARPAFRHELVSALALLGDAGVALHGVERADLVVYLVAAHHGRVRLGIRSVQSLDNGKYVLGVEEGDVIPAVDVPGGQCPQTMVSLDVVRMGRNPRTDQPSWSERSLRLLDELGPFKLGFLEALVRVADWRASAGEEVSHPALSDSQDIHESSGENK